MTAFGVPVEPEVNRNFAIVSGVTAAKAFATSGVSGVAATARNGIAHFAAASPLTIAASMQRLDRRERRREGLQGVDHIDRAGFEQARSCS